MSASRVAILVILMFFVLELPLTAQTSQGRILGTVADTSGAVVANARVTITNTGTGSARSLATTAAGEYTAPSLEPGSYVVVVEAPGFQKAQHTAVRLEVAKDVRIDFKLAPGAITETMIVTGEAPMVDTTSRCSRRNVLERSDQRIAASRTGFPEPGGLAAGNSTYARRWIPVDQRQWKPSGGQQLHRGWPGRQRRLLRDDGHQCGRRRGNSRNPSADRCDSGV